MVNYTAKDYKRVITPNVCNTNDKKIKKGRLSGRLHNVITKINDNYLFESAVEPHEKNLFYYANDKFVSKKVGAKTAPVVYGSFGLVVFLIMLIIGLTSNNKSENIMVYIIPSFFLLIFLISLIYYFTMPKKECIFNREDGLITFPSFMWKDDVTMPVENIIFSMSGPSGVQGGSAFQLILENPISIGNFQCPMLGKDCYEDLSFVLWYMDKNRPLPPGTAFDPYREKDFERRKAEGFPKPIFPSDIPTPEATPEQQAERERVGGW